MAREQYQLPANGSVGDAAIGWTLQDDAAHTSAAPLAIAATTRQLMTIDGFGSGTNTTYRPAIMENIWANDRINPIVEGETYSLRLDFILRPSVTTAGYATLDLDIGSGSQINIVSRRIDLSKGSGVEHDISVAFPIFCLATFNANGGRFFITPTINVDLYDKSIFIERSYVP